jgi:signal transduction histidine kinase
VRELSENTRSWLVEQALDAVPHALFVVDSLRAGRPNVLVNAAYSALTGYEADEAVAPGFDALAIFVEAAEVAALDADGGQVSATKPLRVRRRDGTTFPAMLELRSVQRGEGRYVVGLFASDDSGQGAANRAPHEPLDPVASAAAKPNKEEFFSWLSHELRSPLNACVMWLDVLALSPQPDKLAKAVDAIKRNLARQARLVSEISDAAKVSSGRLALDFEPVDVVTLVKRELDTWQSLATPKQIEFQHRLELAAAPLAGDPARLTHAFNQLVENAIASTPAGGRVELRVHSVNGHCAVEVVDTGVALTPEDAANLGVPLWRAPTAPRARSGLGLGLAVAHHVAAEHGGSLTAVSAASGARLVMTLPLIASGDTGSVAQTDRT